MTLATDKMIAKIDALLAQAEDPSVTAEEAELFMGKAEELMLKYSIDRAKLGAKDASKKEAIESHIVKWDGPKCYFKSAGYFGSGFMTNAAGLVRIAYGNGYVVLYGTRTDMEYTERLIRAMWAQALAAVATYRNTDVNVLGIKETIGTNNMTYWNSLYQYVSGFCKGMSEKVAESRETYVAATTGAELVLASRKAEIDTLFAASTTKGRGKRIGGGAVGSYGKGKAAGREASLATGTIGGTRKGVTK